MIEVGSHRAVDRRTGPQLENNLTQEIKSLLEGWLEPTPTRNALPTDSYRRATKIEDLRLGTDFFLFGIPVDVTEKPISEKDHAEDLYHTMSFLADGDKIIVDFGIRYGNSYNGFTRFNRPVLTLSIHDYEEYLAHLNDERISNKRPRKEIAEAFGRHFDDIVCVGKFLYDDSVRKPKNLVALVTRESSGALYTNQGQKYFQKLTSHKTGVPKEEIEVYPVVNPHIDTIREIIGARGVMAYAIDQMPDNSTREPGSVYSLKPGDFRDTVLKLSGDGRGHTTVWDAVIERHLE